MDKKRSLFIRTENLCFTRILSSFLFLGSSICLMSFSFSFNKFKDKNWENQSAIISKKIKIYIGNAIAKDKSFAFVGTGGGIDDTIHSMHLDFYCYRPVSLEEARELIVYAVKFTLEEINNNSEWTPYFSEYPVTPKTLDLMILFKNPDYSDLSLNELNYVGCLKGDLLFRKISLPGEKSLIHEETYQQGLAIVSAKRNNTLLVENKEP